MDEKLDLKKYIVEIPDWPKEGVLFRDLMPLFADSAAFRFAVKQLKDKFADSGVDYVTAIEARGFIIGSVLATELNAGFIPIRKKGKLPGEVESLTYDLEYGQDTIQAHKNAFEKGANILMVDDLLATGGTMAAACRLIEKLGGNIIGIAFLVELSYLGGRDKLSNYDLYSLMSF